MEHPEEPGVCSGNPPAVVARGPGGEGWITGTGWYVEQVVEVMDRLGSITSVARETGLSDHQVRVALEYAERGGIADTSSR
jgi:uncharacterized protein (DUF433 family)